jgi:hypothetical protein
VRGGSRKKKSAIVPSPPSVPTPLAAAAVAAPGPLCAPPPVAPSPAASLDATQSPCAVAAAARAGRERPARLIGLDLACALLAFSRLRAGGGSI